MYLYGHNGEGQSSHVLVFCVNLELWEIISFTFKSNYYVHVAVSGLQYICCLTKLLLQAKNFKINKSWGRCHYNIRQGQAKSNFSVCNTRGYRDHVNFYRVSSEPTRTGHNSFNFTTVTFIL